MRIRITLLVVVVTAASLALALQEGKLRIPDRYNPLAPLVLADPPSFLTRLKLAQLGSDAGLCRAVLAQAPFRYEWIPDRTTGPGCGTANALRVTATGTQVGTPFVLSCRSAVALAMWERHELQPQAIAHFGAPVARIEHLGSYACRNVDGRDDTRRSQHATADALDLAAFVLADGRRIRVSSDWARAGQASAFLRAVHRGACRYFDAVLGPDYNAAHGDHLHLDRGSYRVCR